MTKYSRKIQPTENLFSYTNNMIWKEACIYNFKIQAIQTYKQRNHK